MNSFLVLLFCVVTIAAVTAADYCSKSLCLEDRKHIGCNNTENFANSCPADAALVNIDDKLQSVILDAHNAKRNFIAGGGDAKHRPACRMATMQWDYELASLAALNVKQCEISYDQCRNTDAFRYSGQNIEEMSFYGTPNDTLLLQKVVDKWYSEVSNSKMKYIKSYPTEYEGPYIAHYTVMVTERNTRLGCAASTFSTSNNPNEPKNTYLVACNYATRNMRGLPIYKSCKNAARACTSGVNPKYRNLCSTKEAYAVNEW